MPCIHDARSPERRSDAVALYELSQQARDQRAQRFAKPRNAAVGFFASRLFDH